MNPSTLRTLCRQAIKTNGVSTDSIPWKVLRIWCDDCPDDIVQAAERGQYDSVNYFLTTGKYISADYCVYHDDSIHDAFRAAAEKGYTDIMKLLKEWGADIFDKALLDAADGGHVEAMKLLREWGCRQTFVDGALVCAAGNGHVEAMKLLREWGVSDFNRPLRRAAEKGYLDIMRLLREWGASDIDGALRWAAWRGRVEAMKLLREWGASDIDEALVWAAWWNRVEATKLLTEWGASDLDEALEVVAGNDHVEAMKLLIEWGVDVSRVTLRLLRKLASVLKIKGRSRMKKEDLVTAIKQRLQAS